ncbi:AAA family ATPase [candidate division KSB1 bacterium]|nr:AAA family ATPase [bacterium]NUM68326.1 AAA family ATPase [candidate division KSB1 bacterium]
MLTSLRLGNFKAFAEAQQLPLKPLTLIFGANSAGKSSLIHGLILAHEAYRTGTLDVHRTELGGESVDLGGFRQYVHRREAMRRVEWAAELDVAYLTGRLAELLTPVQRVGISLNIGLELDDKGEPIVGVSPAVIAYEIEADGSSLLRASRRAAGYLQIDRLEHEHPVFREVVKAIVQTATTAETLSPTDYEGLDEAIAELVPELAIDLGNFLPKGLRKPAKRVDDAESPMLFLISKGNRKEDLAAAVRFFLPRAINELIRGLSEAVSGQLSRLHYLGPLRSYPPRHLAFAQHHDPNRFAGGGYAWDVVRENTSVREKVNIWLGDKNKLSTPYELKIRHLLTIDDLQEDYTNRIEELERKFTEEKYDWDLFGEIYGALGGLESLQDKISILKELILVDKRTNTNVSHRDVGIGVSQVLPVLVSAFASKEEILAIEQPEIHLHPALQAELGDVFIEAALGEQRNTFILETHSEHLILRILRRIRETAEGDLPKGLVPIKPEDVQVVYARPTTKGTVLHNLPVSAEGEFLEKWPDGFFPERAEELF